MSDLPYDYSRCFGRVLTVQNNPFSDYDVPEAECNECLRRTSPWRPNGPQSFSKPPEFVDGKCPKRIGEEK